MNARRTQEMINVIKYAFYSGEDVEHCIKILKRTFGPDVLENYPHEVEEAFDATDDMLGHEYRTYIKHGHRGVIRSSLDEGRNTMGKLLKERWNRLAFAKGNQSLNESDRFHGILPQELWEISDYEDLRDSGISLAMYSDEELEMKIEQIEEEIEEEKNYMDDPQNQYDSAIAPKESLINAIRDIIGKVHVQGSMNESRLRRVIRQSILSEHLHGYKGKNNEKYMIRPIPEEAKQLPHWDEYEEEFRMAKEAIDGNYRKMTNLSIDYPKMNTRNVDEDAMDYKHYHEMSATEKYVYCKNELMYLWEDLIRLWKELDEELGIEDGFAGY